MTALVKLLLKNGELYTEEFRNNFSGQGSVLKNPQMSPQNQLL